MTWAVSPVRRRPGDLLTRADVCHLHADRAAAERCGAGLGGAPDLVGLAPVRERVYRVEWSLSDAAGGTLRTAPPPPPVAPAPAACDHGPGCCTACCPVEDGSSGTGTGCRVCQPGRTGETQRDRDGRAGFAALFVGASHDGADVPER